MHIKSLHHPMIASKRFILFLVLCFSFSSFTLSHSTKKEITIFYKEKPEAVLLKEYLEALFKNITPRLALIKALKFVLDRSLYTDGTITLEGKTYVLGKKRDLTQDAYLSWRNIQEHLIMYILKKNEASITHLPEALKDRLFELSLQSTSSYAFYRYLKRKKCFSVGRMKGDSPLHCSAILHDVPGILRYLAPSIFSGFSREKIGVPYYMKVFCESITCAIYIDLFFKKWNNNPTFLGTLSWLSPWQIFVFYAPILWKIVSVTCIVLKKYKKLPYFAYLLAQANPSSPKAVDCTLQKAKDLLEEKKQNNLNVDLEGYGAYETRSGYLNTFLYHANAPQEKGKEEQNLVNRLINGFYHYCSEEKGVVSSFELMLRTPAFHILIIDYIIPLGWMPNKNKGQASFLHKSEGLQALSLKATELENLKDEFNYKKKVYEEGKKPKNELVKITKDLPQLIEKIDDLSTQLSENLLSFTTLYSIVTNAFSPLLGSNEKEGLKYEDWLPKHGSGTINTNKDIIAFAKTLDASCTK